MGGAEMSEWKKVKLGDISVSIQPGPFGTQLHNSDYTDDGVPVIMPKDMIDGRVMHNKLEHVSEETANRISRHKVKTGDIMVARKGDVRKCIYIRESEEGWITGSDCLKMQLNHGLCNSQFIYYQLRSPYIGAWLQKVSKGATMPSLNSTLLGNIEIVLPSLSSQNRIATILSRYDSLIENYQKQIKLLEEAAQRLYKEWFVDFRFPSHETAKIVDGVPEGWEKKKVGDLIAKVQRTKQVPANEYMKTGNIPVIDQSRNYIAGYTNDNECLVKVSTPYIVFGDHTRVLKYIPFSFAKGADGTQLIMSNDLKRMPQSLFYISLIGIDLSNYSYARHFKYLKEEVILVPSTSIATSYDNVVAKYYYTIQTYRDTIRILTEALDRLLPRLMSGEIKL